MKTLAPYSEIVSRRRALALFGATATLLGCGGGGGGSSTTSSATSTTTGTTGGTSGSVSCVLTPQETAGPYPLFNDIASASTYTREDITEGKTGVPLRLLLTFINVNANCAPITNALVYAWHWKPLRSCVFRRRSRGRSTTRRCTRDVGRTLP